MGDIVNVPWGSLEYTQYILKAHVEKCKYCALLHMFHVLSMCNMVHTVYQHKGAVAVTAAGAKSQNPAHVYPGVSIIIS